MSDPAPLVLTLFLDESSFALFDGMRRRFFPPDRNLVPAHVTLFHALPGAERPAITADLVEACRAQTFALAVTGLRSLGGGVAYAIESQELSHLRQHLARRWSDWLTPQDRQAYRPHVTVQNKVAPEQAKALMGLLQADFAPFPVTAEGLMLWHYRGGPWEPVRRFVFGVPERSFRSGA